MRSKLAKSVLVYRFTGLLFLTEPFIILPNADNLYVPSQPDLKHSFFKNLKLMACLVSRKAIQLIQYCSRPGSLVRSCAKTVCTPFKEVVDYVTLDKVAPLRDDVNSIFLIIYHHRHKPVPSRTLARWVSDILRKAGIHTKTSKTYSLRFASISNALGGGISLTEIEKTARWKNVKTFGKLYNKPMIDNNLGIFLLTNSLQICA